MFSRYIYSSCKFTVPMEEKTDTVLLKDNSASVFEISTIFVFGLITIVDIILLFTHS